MLCYQKRGSKLIQQFINDFHGPIKHLVLSVVKQSKIDKYHTSNAAHGFTKNIYKLQGELKLIITH